MRRWYLCFALMLLAGRTGAQAVMMPTERQLPPLAMVDHQVHAEIEEQVAVTRIEQTFRNHSSRPIEATYFFPVPKGASVRKFSMWVDGKEVPGELVEADKARKIYTDIVQRTLDPGLLEYMGSSLMKLRVFPVPPNGDQKVSISYTSIAQSDHGMVEYLYPLRTDQKAAALLEKFSLKVSLKSQHALTNLYSPSHAITISRSNEREAVVSFEKDKAVLDRDFQLFYQTGGKDIGVTTLVHRPTPGQPGTFMLLMSPRAELSKSYQVPRDMVFVLDTSGSMRGKRMTQARNALKFCLDNLGTQDRFGLLHFATTVNPYMPDLQPSTPENVAAAKKWVDGLEATGGTAIDAALAAGLAMRADDRSRVFNLVFFTDGRPTIGETNGEKIQANVVKRNSANTRIFTFGVGDDVNAVLLDGMADASRAVSTYVRESEDIEAKVSGLYAKISNPVLSNLKLVLSPGVRVSDMYPPQLPDLFHGSQLVIMGRYEGEGATSLTLSGTVGADAKEFVYEADFPAKTQVDKPFVEDLWARRKVGYMLDQIRLNGEKKELVDEVVALAKKHGITTPYTSYLMVPDNLVIPGPRPRPLPVIGREVPPPALLPAGPAQPQMRVEDFARRLGENGAASGEERNKILTKQLETEQRKAELTGDAAAAASAKDALESSRSNAAVRQYFQQRQHQSVQGGRVGVDFAVQNNQLRNQTQLERTASRNIQNRNVLDIGGVWIDESFNAKRETVTVKAMSAAYFRMLERQPSLREVFRLGNYVIWVTPSGRALIIDQANGREEMADAEIDALFVANVK